MQAKWWEKTREAASTEGRQAGNCGCLRNRRDATEERSRSTSEAGVRPATIAANWAWTIEMSNLRVQSIRDSLCFFSSAILVIKWATFVVSVMESLTQSLSINIESTL